MRRRGRVDNPDCMDRRSGLSEPKHASREYQDTQRTCMRRRCRHALRVAAAPLVRCQMQTRRADCCRTLVMHCYASMASRPKPTISNLKFRGWFMQDPRSAVALRETLQFVAGSDIPSKHKGVLLDCLTQSLRAYEAAQTASD